jgi:hypothetical protein
MVCVKKLAVGVTQQTFAGEYATERECLEKCKMGACCVNLTCSVVPSCACARAGGVFFGEGESCPGGASPYFRNDLLCCYPLREGCNGAAPSVRVMTVTDSVGAINQGQCVVNISGSYGARLQPPSQLYGLQDCGTYGGLGSVSASCWQLQYGTGNYGVAPLVFSAVFSIIRGQASWRATIDTADRTGTFATDGQNQLATGYGGPPCTDANFWSPAAGCYSGSATLYRYRGGSSSSSCASKWTSVGTVTIGQS